MNDETILFIIYSAYLFIPKREHFFIFIYSGLILSNIFKYFKILFFYKIRAGKKLLILIEYPILYLISYFLIKDPNPFYQLLAFYLPLPNLFKGIFIVIFITYLFNNKMYNIEQDNTPIKKVNNEEQEKPQKEDDDYKEIKDKDIGEKKDKNKKIYPFFLSEYFTYFLKNKKKFIFFILTLISIRLLIYFYKIKYWIYFTPKEIALPSDTEKNTKYYICAIVCNIEPIAIDWIGQMKLLIDYLGKENVYISILENQDSKDNTRKFLEEFRQYLNNNKISNQIVLEKINEKNNKERIVYLSELRDLSLNYLYEIENLDFSNTKIIFMNDIIYRFQDVIKLIGTNNGDYDAVCAMDYYEGFYDNWASQLYDGHYFRRYYPYMGNKEAQDAIINGDLIRTFSCWNGVTVFSAKPFEDRVLYFRYGYKARQSECLLIHSDMQMMGFQKTLVNPNIAVAYTYEYYYKNHYLYPWTKNLVTYFYYYFRYGFRKRNYKMTNIKDRGISLDEEFEYLWLRFLTK